MPNTQPGVELGSRSMPALTSRRLGLGARLTGILGLFFLLLSVAGAFTGDALTRILIDESAWLLDRQGLPGDAETIRATLAASVVAGRTGTWALFGGLMILGFLFVTVWVHLRVTTPLRDAVEEVQALAAGQLHRRLDVDRTDEIGDLGVQINFLAAELQGFSDRVTEHARILEAGVEERTNALAQRNLELNKAYREKELAYDELQEAQMHLVQQERMATLGQLLAGIAHEINNPVNYMVNAIRPLQANVGRIDDLLSEQEEALLAHIHEEDSISARPDLARVMADIQQSVDLIRAGADRTARIVQNLRSFSRTSEGDLTQVDLEQGIEVTLSLLNHLIKGRIEVVREFEPVERVECVQGEINQVFMNLLSNAAQAIKGSGTIWVRLRPLDGGVEFAVQDDGCGISADNLARIFEPFFTTKEQGVGTGLGLSISQNLISKHGGDITVASQEGKGTEFVVWIPQTQEASEDVA